MGVTLGELATRFGCELHGPADRVVTRVGTLSGATPDALSFLANPAYRAQLVRTRAAAVILDERNRTDCPVAALVHPQPYLIYARIASWLHPPLAPRPGVHATAVVGTRSRIDATAEVGANVVIGDDVTIGAGAVLGAGSVLGAGVSIGAGTRIGARVAVLDHVRIGERCVVHPGAVLGADGFGFAPDAGKWQKIPQVGGVVLGNDVEIGANSTIDRGAIEDTVIEDGVKLDNLVHIAHNVRIGRLCLLMAQVGVAGSVHVGDGAVLAGQVGVSGHHKIGKGATLAAQAGVFGDIPDGETWSGYPARPHREALRAQAALFKLPSLLKRIERFLDGTDA